MDDNDQANAEQLDAQQELFSEYYEGTLDAQSKVALEARLSEDPDYQSAYQEFEKTMQMLSGLHKMSAPADFDKKVEETIHRRSGGRFFGRRAFGDRIPFEALAIVVMILAVSVYWLGRSSGTGGHKFPTPDAPEIQGDTQEIMPQR